MKLYTFTLYQLTGIQKGIQSAHAAVEFGIGEYVAIQSQHEEAAADYVDWATNHKTMILLDGGTTQTMSDRMTELCRRNIPYAVFREPDLSYLVTAIAFILKPDNLHMEWVKQFALASN